MRYPLLIVGAVGGGLGCTPGRSLTAPAESTADHAPGAQLVVLTLTPPAVTGDAGDTVTVRAAVTNAQGQPVSSPSISWSSRDTTVATVSSAGVVHLRSAGSTQLLVVASGISDSAQVTVNGTTSAAVIAAVHLSATTATLTSGGTATLTATVLNAAGAAMSGQTITWATSNTSVATVKASTATAALVTAVAAGTAVVTASTGGKAATATISVSASKPAAPAGEIARSSDGFVETIGVATHISYASAATYASVLKPLLIQSGVRYIRDGAVGVSAQMNELATYGIHSTVVMDPRVGINPSTVVADVITPVLSSIIAVEGPNEWDLAPTLTWEGQTFPAAERAFQSELYAAVKNASSAVVRALPVLAPSMGQPGDGAALGSVPCDLGNMHSYQGGNLPDDQLTTRWIPNTQLVSGPKPIVVTETGYNYDVATGAAGQPGVSDAAAAKYAPRIYLEYYNHGLTRTHIYVMYPDPDWGLIDQDGNPRLSYYAIQNTISLLGDPGGQFTPGALSYTVTGAPSTLHHLLLQKRDGRFYLVLWLNVSSFNTFTHTDVSTADPITIHFATPVSKVKTYLPSQSATAQSTTNAPTSLSVNAPDQALVLEITPR